MNLSLKPGVLKDVFLRKNKKLVLEELARVWKLEPTTVADLEKVFGANVQRTLSEPLGQRRRRRRAPAGDRSKHARYTSSPPCAPARDGRRQPLPTTAKSSFLPSKPGYNDLTTE